MNYPPLGVLLFFVEDNGTEFSTTPVKFSHATAIPYRRMIVH